MSYESRRLVILVSVFSLLAVLILNFFFFQKSNEERFLETLQEKIQKVDREFDEDFIQILMNVRSTDSISFERMELSGNIHPYFLLDSNRNLIYWSDFTFSFDFEQIDQDKEYQLIEDPFGSILIKVRQISRNGAPVLMVQALRLIYPGNIENDYLVTGANPEIFGNNRFTLFTNAEEGRYQVKNPGGIPIFGIDFLFGYQPADRLANPAILIFFTSVFLLYFLLSSDFVRSKWNKKHRWQAIGYAIIVLIAFRLIMLLLDFPGSYLNISLFDPANYASSWLNPSLGDLLLNTVCAVIVFGMIIYHLASQEMRYKVQSLKEATEIRVFGVIILAISSMALWMVWVLPRDIISNSQWALDISSIPSSEFRRSSSPGGRETISRSPTR